MYLKMLPLLAFHVIIMLSFVLSTTPPLAFSISNSFGRISCSVKDGILSFVITFIPEKNGGSNGSILIGVLL